jgi:hypothetical protein
MLILVYSYSQVKDWIAVRKGEIDLGALQGSARSAEELVLLLNILSAKLPRSAYFSLRTEQSVKSSVSVDKALGMLGAKWVDGSIWESAGKKLVVADR